MNLRLCVLDSLSLVPHPNVIAAVALDDSQLGTMPVLLPKAECDFHKVLTSGGWSLSELLRQVFAVTVMKCVQLYWQYGCFR